MKKIASMVIAATFTTNVFATEMQVATSVAPLSELEIQTAFQQTSQPLQLATLSQQEMKETEGANFYLSVAVFTIGGGLFGMGLNSALNSGYTNSQAFAMGAVGGLYATPMPVGVVGAFVQYSLGATAGAWMSNFSSHCTGERSNLMHCY